MVICRSYHINPKTIEHKKEINGYRTSNNDFHDRSNTRFRNRRMVWVEEPKEPK